MECCKRLALPLDLVTSLADADPYFAEALAHIDNCSPCHDRLVQRLTSEQAIRQTLDISMAPPPELVDSILASTRAVSSTRFKSYLFRRVAVAATVVLSFLTITGGYITLEDHNRSLAMERLRNMSVAEHQTRANPHFASSDPIAVMRWLSEKVGRPVRLPHNVRLNQVVGASISALGVNRVAAVHFSIDGNRSTLYQYLPAEYGVADATEDPSNDGGYAVAVWDEEGDGYSLVSEAPVERVRAQMVNYTVR